MNRPYYIGFRDDGLNKMLFLGANDAYFSDFQSANAYSKPEIKHALPGIKRKCKDKKLKVIKLLPQEVKLK